MSASRSASHIYLTARGTLLELWRRQDVWILTLLMGVFTVIALGARFTGEATPATGTFMLNLGMSLSVLFAHGMTVLIAARQFPTEIENRTLYPLLAKPLTRDNVLIGKWAACSLGGMATFLAFHVIALAVSPPAEPYSAGMHAQHLLAQGVSIPWAAALAIALSLSLPRALGLLCSLLFVFGGDALYRWLENRLVLAHLFPRFGAMNLATRVTDGAPMLGGGELGLLVGYGLIWTALCLLAARNLWIRRAL